MISPIARFLLLLLLLALHCSNAYCERDSTQSISSGLRTGAEKIESYLPLLEGKRVGMVVNHTAMVGDVHLVDTLIALGIQIKAVFAPEHGFRGEADAGAEINHETDPKTGIPIYSVFGKTRKPTAEMMADLDILLFDIQDVGVRFYTYISTLHNTMEAAAENHLEYIVLDRPNPNGNYVDGPIRTDDQKSFVGMHPIPIVHGLTVGELARMINQEGWLAKSIKVKLTVIEMDHYNHQDEYSLPVKPSPNLPSDEAIRLYPSVCLFEGTAISVGRGTLDAFQQIGHPSFINQYDHSFTPKSIPGMSTSPKHIGERCYGLDLATPAPPRAFTLEFLLEFYERYEDKKTFFNEYFNRLAGTSQLKDQIEAGKSEDEIRASWQPGLARYKAFRSKYLLYP